MGMMKAVKRRRIEEQGTIFTVGDTGHSCNHSVCQDPELRHNLIPYAGIGACYIPPRNNAAAVASYPDGRVILNNLHNTAYCDNSCDNCKALNQPPPSYSKVCLDEPPPDYTDDMYTQGESLRQMANSSSVPDGLTNGSSVPGTSSSTPITSVCSAPSIILLQPSQEYLPSTSGVLNGRRAVNDVIISLDDVSNNDEDV